MNKTWLYVLCVNFNSQLIFILLTPIPKYCILITICGFPTSSYVHLCQRNLNQGLQVFSRSVWWNHEVNLFNRKQKYNNSIVYRYLSTNNIDVLNNVASPNNSRSVNQQSKHQSNTFSGETKVGHQVSWQETAVFLQNKVKFHKVFTWLSLDRYSNLPLCT